MSKLGVSIVAAILMAVGLLAACAPGAAPAPVPAPAAPAPAAQPALALTPEEAAWAQVEGAARKEGKVTLYSYSFFGDIGLALSRAFEGRYGIKVDIITGRGAEFIERLKTEKRIGKIVGDIIEGSPTHLTNIKKAGLTLATKDVLPELKQTQAWAAHPLGMDPEGHVLGYIPTLASPFVNNKLVPPGQEPKSYRELLQPRWKGKMTLADPNISGNAYRLLTYVRQGILDMEYMKALGKQDLIYTTGIVHDIQVLSRGEAALTIYISSGTASPFVAEGAPIRAAGMEEGNLVLFTSIAALNGSPHPKASLLFLNWLFSQEGQTIHGKAKSSASVRRDVPDFTPAAARPRDTRPVIITPEDLDEQGTKLQQRFLVDLWRK